MFVSEGLPPLLDTIECLLFLALLVAITDTVQKPAKIAKIPAVPGYPIVGNALQCRNNPAQTFMKWSNVHGPVFQVRLGVKNVVVVNSHRDVAALWINHAGANNSRPLQHTFHNVVSATQGFTVGSTPQGCSFRAKKKAISQHLNQLNVSRMSDTIDKESLYMIRQIFSTNPNLEGPPSCNIFRHVRCELADVDLKVYGQMFALRSSVFLAYGIRLDCYHGDSELAHEIISVEGHIIKFRSPLGNLADSIPVLRMFPSTTPTEFRQRRDKYMSQLYSTMSAEIARGNCHAASSIVARLVADNKLAPAEIQSICLTMVSAGLDNTPLNFNHLMGQLSQPYGDRIQTRAYSDLLALADGDLVAAWHHSSHNMDCPYVVAMVYETLRFFTALPLGLARLTTKDIHYNGYTIPRNTTVVMNAFAANHDPRMFSQPYEFLPERWLTPAGQLAPKSNLLHYSFGAGSRMCSGNHLALKELYTLAARFVLVFKIKPPTSPALMDLNPFRSNACPTATSFEPHQFKVRLAPRVSPDCDKLYFHIMRR